MEYNLKLTSDQHRALNRMLWSLTHSRLTLVLESCGFSQEEINETVPYLFELADLTNKGEK
jgi:hypothetical protein